MHTFFTITAAQIQQLRGCSYTTARKEWNAIRDALGVRQLMCRQLAAYWDVPVQELAEALYYPLKKQA